MGCLDVEDDDGRDVAQLLFSGADRVQHLLAIGQARRARELAQELISSSPDDPSAFLSLAAVLMYLGERGPAVDAAAQAVQLDPEWPAVWRTHAAALVAAGRFAESERSLHEAIRLDPEDGSSFLQYARALSYCGKEAAALEYTRRALELDPDDESAHAMFAMLLHEVRPKEWELSEEMARRAVELDPDVADSYAVLGWIVFERRRYDEAEEHFRSALMLDPVNALALEGLSHVVMRKNVFYRPFLGYAVYMTRLGLPGQLLVVASLWAIVSVLLVVLAEPASTVVTIAYLALCAYTWFAMPITRAILRRKYSWL